MVFLLVLAIGRPIRYYAEGSILDNTGNDSQFSPAAIMQVTPFGIVRMMVLLVPLWDDRISTTPPLLAIPIATGASEYWLDSWLTTSDRSVQSGC